MTFACVIALLPQYPDFTISEQIVKMPQQAAVCAMFFIEKSLEFNTLPFEWKMG